MWRVYRLEDWEQLIDIYSSLFFKSTSSPSVAACLSNKRNKDWTRTWTGCCGIIQLPLCLLPWFPPSFSPSPFLSLPLCSARRQPSHSCATCGGNFQATQIVRCIWGHAVPNEWAATLTMLLPVDTPPAKDTSSRNKRSGDAHTHYAGALEAAMGVNTSKCAEFLFPASLH